ncbi:hypothetical protein Clacol_010257 [Clathrus columnatus]|uniref:Uncharacterized protein n=1 Tax=Clathrus columnatus TaxID=1419009 RepID=A0AAV5AR39_9AGAM|nr:hypothetical protein Clacol_010257 [Clathrus columnatus]
MLPLSSKSECPFGPSSQPQPEYQVERVASIVKTFLQEVGYVPTKINPVNKALEDYMEHLMNTRGLACEQLKKTINFSASLSELGCYKSTLEEKKNVAFGVYIDDKVTKDPAPFKEFASRLIRNQQQLDPILTAFTEVLGRMWDSYDPLAASAIFDDALSFVTGTCIEPELHRLPLVQGINRFSWYIRDLTGASNAYGLFPFTKSGNFNMLNVVQALPDMNFWTCLTNDLLSFHKEESTGETGTFIYNRARNDNKSRYETCEEIVAELRDARQTIHKALANNAAALEAWTIWERGYM